MFNLLIAGDEDSFEGKPIFLDLPRCVREYTDKEIQGRFAELDSTSIIELRKLPCIFGYEPPSKKLPKFGLLIDIIKRQGQVRIQYEIIDLPKFLSATDLANISFELDIQKNELYRTHWAVKNINLAKELASKGINLPAWARGVEKAVDISTQEFDVALSFPGEARDLVEKIAQEIERIFGPNSYFYDNNYKSQLARPSLDTLLQDIYRNRSKLVVVFLSGDYQKKLWCGIEFRAIKEVLMKCEHEKIMFVKTDDGNVEGVFKTDGYIDARKSSPIEIARFIWERVEIIKNKVK